MGIGIFAVWPLAKKFGKKNVTLFGFILYAIGSLICWLVPTNMTIVLIGQFIKNIGGLPCAYVFMALFADGLDHLEWKSGIRCDGTAMSVYNIIAVAIIGVATAIFNALLASAGYVAPELIDGVTVAAEQTTTVTNVITFAFVGLESITGLILAGLLVFLTVEKTITKKQQLIRERRKAEVEEAGGVWVDPEDQAQIDEENFFKESEEIFASELKEKCEKNGKDYEKELAAHKEMVQQEREKREKKKRLAEEKAEVKRLAAEQKEKEKLAKLTEEKRKSREEKAKIRKEKEDAAWEKELKKGNEFYAKIKKELASIK